MHGITDADRKAAEQLRAILADISGFWHQAGEDSPLYLALKNHRLDAERRIVEKLTPLIITAMPEGEPSICERGAEPRLPRVFPQIDAIDPLPAPK